MALFHQGAILTVTLLLKRKIRGYAKMKFYFIRHGQSENNILLDQLTDGVGFGEGNDEYLRKRYADAPLSSLGKQQVKLLGKFIADKTNGAQSGTNGNASSFDEFRFTHLYVSPMIRALDTAAAVAAALDIDPTIWEDIHEQGGLWTQDGTVAERIPQPGMTPELLNKNYPGFTVPSTMPATGWWNRPHEKMEACHHRSGRVLEELLKKHGDTEDKVAVVSHGTFFNNLMFQLFGYSPQDLKFFFAIQNVSITRVDFDNKIKKLVYLNRVEFIPDHMIS